MKEKTWILVAHETGATLLEYKAGKDGELQIARTINYPQGSLKSRNIDSDRPGRGMNSRSQRRFTFDVNKKPERENAKKFAKRLTTIINTGAEGNKYDHLILVAEPRMLGLLREGLKKKTHSKIKSEIKKDFGRLSDSALIKRVLPFVQGRGG